MKKNFGLLILAVCVLSGLLFTSCEKEKTETNMIIRNWTLVSKTLGSVNITPDSEKNSKWDFKSDGTYVIKESSDKTKTGTWKLADDGKTLTFDGITAYKVINNTLLDLVIEMQVAEVGLVRWTFN